MEVLAPGLSGPLLLITRATWAKLGLGGFGAIGVATGRNVSPHPEQINMTNKTAAARARVINPLATSFCIESWRGLYSNGWPRSAPEREAVGVSLSAEKAAEMFPYE